MVSDPSFTIVCALNQAESVDDVAQFRGPRKNCTKECVLIIDTQTGEAILEKISNTVQLKAVRWGCTFLIQWNLSIVESLLYREVSSFQG